MPYSSGDAAGIEGDKTVLSFIERAIKGELQAINQYTIHGALLINRGYGELSSHMGKLVEEERSHMQRFLTRSILLGGRPDMMPDQVQIGTDIPSMLNRDRSAEETTIGLYTEAVQRCHDAQDFASRNLFEQILADEQDHFNYLDAQLSLIGSIGFNSYAQLAVGTLPFTG